jgi:hypothetical protein
MKRIVTMPFPDLPHYPLDPLKPMMDTLKVELFEGEEILGVNDKEELILLRHSSTYDRTPMSMNCHFISRDFDFDTTNLAFKGWVKGRALFVGVSRG